MRLRKKWEFISSKSLWAYMDTSLAIGSDGTIYTGGDNFYAINMDPLGDEDQDLLKNGDELTIGTDPLEADTDQDGIDDGAERDYWVQKSGVDYSSDSDGDGKINILDPDSDNDGILDGFEIQYSLDPTNAGDASDDFDNDGLSNLEEFQVGTNPTLADTDGDGLSDGEEVKTYGTNPTLSDTDGDGLSDKVELDYWTQHPGANFDSDTDGDGIINLLDPDSDNDGVVDGKETELGFDPGDPNSKPALPFFTLKSAGTTLANQATLDLGKQGIFKTKTISFTIENLGDLNLDLSGVPKVLVGGTNASDFTVSLSPSSPILPGGSSTFSVEYTPTTVAK